MSFLPNSGAEAVEGAVKLAYKYHGGRRNTILRADISFHGKLLGSGGLTGGAQNRFAFPTHPRASSHFRYGDLDSVRAAVEAARTRTACDVYASSSSRSAPPPCAGASEDSCVGCGELCTAEDIVLIFDEIYTGWGKTGSLFYFMRYPGLVPDVLTTSKSFGGGKSSISAFVAREPVFRKAYDNLTDALLQSTSTTYYGFGEETATAIEAVNIAIEDDYPAPRPADRGVLGPGLERIRKEQPGPRRRRAGGGRAVGGVPGARVEAARPGDPARPGRLRQGPAVRHQAGGLRGDRALYQRARRYCYYTLNGRNPLVVAPPLVATDDDVEYFLDRSRPRSGRACPGC